MRLAGPRQVAERLAYLLDLDFVELEGGGWSAVDRDGNEVSYESSMDFLGKHVEDLDRAVVQDDIGIRNITVKEAYSYQKPPRFLAQANVPTPEAARNGGQDRRNVSAGTYFHVLDAMRAIMAADALVMEWQAEGSADVDALSARIRAIPEVLGVPYSVPTRRDQKPTKPERTENSKCPT